MPRLNGRARTCTPSEAATAAVPSTDPSSTTTMSSAGCRARRPPIVAGRAADSLKAEPAIAAALGSVRFVPHTIGGFGVSVTPEVWRGVFGHDVPADTPAVAVVLMGNRDFQAALQDPIGYQASVDEAVRLVTATG